MKKQDFEPNTFEISQKLDLTGLDEAAAQKMREKVFSKENLDPIVANVLGRTGNNRVDWIRVIWAQWLQWMRAIYFKQETGEHQNEVKEELITKYSMAPK